MAEFERFVTDKQTEFERYRDHLNEEYAKLLNSSWKTFREEQAKKPDMEPKPVNPVVARDDQNGNHKKLQIEKVIAPDPKIPDVPVTLPKSVGKKKSYPINFNFFNTPCGIDKFDTSLLSITKTDNSSLTKAWQQLTANERLTPLVNDCLRLREEMQLCDWGYLLLIEKIAATLYPNSPDNQAFLTVALLNQTGYDSRIGIRGGHIGAMFHPSHLIYGHSFWNIDGKNYYLRGDLQKLDSPLKSYNGDYKKNPTPIRMTMDRYPRLLSRTSSQHEFSSKSWKAAPPFKITVNSSVIEFLDTYPIVEWPIYGKAPVSPELKSVLWPVMSLLTEGMSEIEAVNLLLGFHNYAFNYKTDGDQFGREKPFFFDENYYYPYNDCEDRAIMFAKLVNSILGLDVVYLKYPHHLATAVCFSSGQQPKGTYVVVDGRNYYVCDPTCQGGKAGYLAGQYSNSKPEVYKIK